MFAIVHLGKSSMSPDLRGLIGVLKGGRSEWSSFDQPRIRAAFQLPNGLGIAPAFTGALECESEPSREGVENTPCHLVTSDRLER